MSSNENKREKNSKNFSYDAEISKRIREERKKKNYSQEDLASNTEDLTQVQISKIENNIKQIRVHDLYQIACALDVSMSYLIDGNDTSTELTQLCKYIEISYEKTSYGKDHYTIPIFSINENLFIFLYNEAQRKIINSMGERVKLNWRNEDIANFYKSTHIDSKLEFVPVTKSTVYPSDANNINYSHKDLINSIDQEFNHAVNICLKEITESRNNNE